MAAKTFADILKFNPYHDERGRFTTADSATLFTIRTQDPDKQYLANEGIRREQARHEADLNGPRMKAIHDIEDKIRDQDFESAACVDKDGNVLFFKNGEQSQVEFTKEESELVKGNTLTHNHPSSTMFSPQDVNYWLGTEMQEMRVTTREGVSYSLARGENFTKAHGEAFFYLYAMSREIAKGDTQQELDNRGFRQKLSNGEMTKAEADAEFCRTMAKHQANFWKDRASDFNIEFRVEQRKVNKSAGTEYTAKASDGEGTVVLDKDDAAWYKAAFEEWLNKAEKDPTGKSDPVNTPEVTKSMEDSRAVLFVGLKIDGADSLAIEGGEKTEDFHVTLAYGHFDTHGHDEDDTSVRVQKAIADIRDLIPDSIHFDAQGRFEASESSDGKDVIYAQVAAGQLEKAHDGLLEALKKQGIELEGTFPEYKPHMTLAYIEKGAAFDLKELNADGSVTKAMIGHGWESTHENNYTITKMDEDKRLVFGWASISFTADGEQLEDLQHDIINPEDLEEAVYEYVLNFRDTGEEHRPHLRKKGKLVESCVFTAEKMKAMGLPEGILPVGWWIGFKIEDDEAWEKVKNGTYRMFSIEGRAQRVPVEKAAPEETAPEEVAPTVTKTDEDRFDLIEEFEFP